MSTAHDDFDNSKAVDSLANIRNKISRFTAELEDLMDADNTAENKTRCHFLIDHI